MHGDGGSGAILGRHPIGQRREGRGRDECKAKQPGRRAVPARTEARRPVLQYLLRRRRIRILLRGAQQGRRRDSGQEGCKTCHDARHLRGLPARHGHLSDHRGQGFPRLGSRQAGEPACFRPGVGSMPCQDRGDAERHAAGFLADRGEEKIVKTGVQQRKTGRQGHLFSFSGEKSRLRYGSLFEQLQGLQKFGAQRPRLRIH